MPLDIRDAHRILVITKFRYLGDTIVATPFLKHLRVAAPEAQVTLLSGAQIPMLLLGCPYVDDVWTFDRNAGETRSLISRVRSGQFDTCFLLNRSLHSAYVAFAGRIPQRVGFIAECRGPLLTLRVPYDKAKREIDCYLDLIRAMGLDASYALPELWVSSDEQRAAERMCSDSGIEGHKMMILVQPGAKDAYKKQWAAPKFSHVIDELQNRLINPAFVLIGSIEERSVCDEVVRSTRTRVHNLAGHTNLREILALLSNSNLLLANDTALVHAAAALGVPSVSIHGPQTVAKWSYGPPLHRAITVSWAQALADRHANRRALDLIEPAPVIAAALELLSEERTHIA